ncbi:fimbria/pilus periplasmic chaperone [Acinetobacter johnsonii]|uniref:fimbrial biogenesis chaperone n=1 Tax=Acinetobacter johnsonii TaxID=40214 RepID=UPI00244C7D66|nr:fimbria/pilus periplasmic chaperone [Acinetobacter johnsonii]MDH1365820.1 fimbria/pilus periplasmic chaperone [Acinetobacter johnsonii]MDM1251841.1 fimbria/pilus periplasmic chaperone [Acinetobacter johnsonii]
MRNIILTLLTACCMNLTQAGVSIDGTRIIFPASSTSVGVQVRNEFSTPALVQTWIDNGNMNEIPPAEEIPFVISPPLSRVEPHQGQIIRVIQTGSPELPEDRESLFWFNLLDVPPDNPNFSTQNLLSFTVRTRIKMFYRPAKLKMSINEAYNQIHFKYLNDEQKLEVNNPTPYYITFVNINFKSSSDEKAYKQSVMLEPYSNQKLSDFKFVSAPQKIDYSILNDLGGVQTFSKNTN